MAKFFDFKIVVEGRGPFPLDMLRYDRCYPRSEADANRAQDEERVTERRRIELTHREPGSPDGRGRHWMPEIGRWESFGWPVISLEEVK
jgi:hypothetical protein